MDILLNNTHSSLITITLITIFLFFIKNKLINVIFALSQKTNTVYDELILFSIKSPSTYLILFGYIFVITDYFVKNETLNINFSLSSSVFSLIIIIISWSLLRGLNYYLELKPFTKKLSSDDDITLITETYEIVIRILKILVVTITALIIMQEIGLSISGLLAFGGVGGLIVGLAAKDLLSNFFGGMMIFFDRPFRVGEFIKSPDRNIEGVVEKIGWRLTVVRTFSKNVLYIPNTAFSSIIVENATRMSNRRINETIGIRYDDLNKMKDIIQDVNNILENNMDIDQTQKAKVYFKSFSASSCDFFIYAFTITKDWEEFLRIKQDVLLKVAEIIEKHNAEIAYPTTTVFINKESSK
jgi:MscS family membrane protein